MKNFDPNIVQLIEFEPIGAPDVGYIGIAEFQKNIPFEIKRVFWTYYTPHHVIRGRHAHHELKQILVAVAGIITVRTEDRQGNHFEFALDKPNIGLYLPPDYWHTMQFSHSGMMMSLASMEYDENDYIRNYDDFKNG